MVAEAILASDLDFDVVATCDIAWTHRFFGRSFVFIRGKVLLSFNCLIRNER